MQLASVPKLLTCSGGQQGDQRITKVELELLAPRATNAYRMATRTRTYLPRISV